MCRRQFYSLNYMVVIYEDEESFKNLYKTLFLGGTQTQSILTSARKFLFAVSYTKLVGTFRGSS